MLGLGTIKRKVFGNANDRKIKVVLPIVAKINKLESDFDKLSDEEIIKVMIENPKLIERPIVINGEKAAIGRPLENITSIL